ncbi:hypothetical protein WR164_00040 [Philodulcilactobacillus myokoensis]|uniref:Replication-associated protein ORF2/G2P domain-containing protein n=1 Tax=Philodulcilactobacillus myokoensis TaxID=2929573 RepID=A0A9W6AXU0_9LACO|nr:hypothetical protein [Philodulcilactobacillus myokoensis]GLB46022.1 hypothetical protein WR164_00010 [Philodulcilactobacillus myokoensis]GLB46025.1 hypothetical protein WR164_00040 [Philodulcilactobacillus myokoensis]
MLKEFNTRKSISEPRHGGRGFKPSKMVKKLDKYSLLYNTPIKIKMTGAYSTVTTQHKTGNVIKITSKNTYVNTHGEPVKKFGKHDHKAQYVNIETGEILKQHHIKHYGKTKAELPYANLAKTSRRLTDLIHCNFNGANNELLVTATYNSIFNSKYIKIDVKKWLRKLKERLNIKTSELVYIVVFEPQGNGNWHCHILFKFLNKINTEMAIIKHYIYQSWAKGYLNLKHLSRPDWLAKHYFRIDLDKINSKNKRKRARLNDYRANQRTFVASKNVSKPIIIKTIYNSEIRAFLGVRLWYKAFRFDINNHEKQYNFNCYTGYYYNAERMFGNAKNMIRTEQIAVSNYNKLKIKQSHDPNNQNVKSVKFDIMLKQKWWRAAKDNDR